MEKRKISLKLQKHEVQSNFHKYSKIIDKNGKLNFEGKAVLHKDGVDFSNGTSYQIGMSELETKEILGKGQYGIVYKAMHLATGVLMAIKEIKVELDTNKLKQIITELDILHKSSHITIVEFYGAFFAESCVYYCMEYMDVGSLDLLCWKGTSEDVSSIIIKSVKRNLDNIIDG